SDNVVREENIETASTVTNIIPASTVNFDNNSTVILTQNNQPEPIYSELIDLDISNTLQKAKNLANSSLSQINETLMFFEKALRTIKTASNDNATSSLSGYIQSQPEGLQQCIAAQRVPDCCKSVEKLHEFLPDCERIPGPFQHLKVTQWVASIDGKEEHDAFNSRMEEKQPPTNQESSKNSPSSQKQKFQCKKEITSSKQGQRQGTSHNALQPGLQNLKHSAGCH
ncbi:hypothetical protein O181_001878, partial [Austropuccinia psidii MF-1]|nr:hypothetical protein [Austropuccinia psidii MF-1]